MKGRLGFAWLLLLIFLGPARGKELTLLTLFAPLYCFSANLVRDRDQVDALLSGNTSPHDYHLSVRDRQKVDSADLIVVNGLGLDDWITPILNRSRKEDQVVIASAGLAHELIFAHGKPNPHIWLDPILAIHCVSNISEALIRSDPVHASSYRQNSSNYVGRLLALDGEIRAALSPFHNAQIVTFHDSFRYFARRYGLTVAGIIEEVPDVSPSARQLARLYQTIRKEKPKCIFTEPQFPSRLAEQMAKDLGVSIASLDTLETGRLNAEAYERGMRANLRVLQEKLK